MEGKERVKKEAEHSRLVGSRFNKHGNLLTKFVLDNHKMSKSLHLAVRIFKVYIVASSGFSRVHNPGVLNTILYSQS